MQGVVVIFSLKNHANLSGPNGSDTTYVYKIRLIGMEEQAQEVWLGNVLKLWPHHLSMHLPSLVRRATYLAVVSFEF